MSVAVILLLMICRRQNRQCVHPISWGQREFGYFYTLVRDLEDYPDHFSTYVYMDVVKFQHLLQLVEDDISKRTLIFAITLQMKRSYQFASGIYSCLYTAFSLHFNLTCVASYI